MLAVIPEHRKILFMTHNTDTNPPRKAQKRRLQIVFVYKKQCGEISNEILTTKKVH